MIKRRRIVIVSSDHSILAAQHLMVLSSRFFIVSLHARSIILQYGCTIALSYHRINVFHHLVLYYRILAYMLWPLITLSCCRVVASSS